MSAITKEQIESWKKEHKDIFEITVEDKKGYFKKPSRKTLMYASSMLQSNPLKFNEILLNECWIGGDECIKTDDDYFLSVVGQLAGIVEIKNAELKKL